MRDKGHNSWSVLHKWYLMEAPLQVRLAEDLSAVQFRQKLICQGHGLSLSVHCLVSLPHVYARADVVWFWYHDQVRYPVFTLEFLLEKMMQKIFSCYSATSCSVAYLGLGGLRMENAAGGVGGSCPENFESNALKGQNRWNLILFFIVCFMICVYNPLCA